MNEDRSTILRRASEHWSRVTATRDLPRRNWWESPTIVSHINEIVTGEAEIHGQSAGFNELIRTELGGRVAEKGLSVGCGVGEKEMALVQQGLVGSFDLYEISPERITRGIERAKLLGIQQQIRFHESDAFVECRRADYDIIHWNNSLHHMLDVDFAIAWSLERLKRGGIFAMDDFVGPSRFQWSDRVLDYATRFRASLPDHYRASIDPPHSILSVTASRPSIESMIAMDPTEAADSGNILGSLARRLPDGRVTPTGGAIYVVGLYHILPNFDEVEDHSILQAGLLIDQLLAESGDTLYAVAIGHA